MDIPGSADIAFIGGGVMCASSAYPLAAAGHKNIVLLEKEYFYGTGATGRCAGGTGYQFATDVNIRFSIASLPILGTAGLASHWAGLYEVTPDARPIFGRTPVDGIISGPGSIR